MAVKVAVPEKMQFPKIPSRLYVNLDDFDLENYDIGDKVNCMVTGVVKSLNKSEDNSEMAIDIKSIKPMKMKMDDEEDSDESEEDY